MMGVADMVRWVRIMEARERNEVRRGEFLVALGLERGAAPRDEFLVTRARDAR